MNKILLLIAHCLLPVVLLAQNDDAQKYAATITRDDLKKHLTIVASAEMEGRETGTKGQRKAAEYIEAQFKLLGLQPSPKINGFQQTYTLYKDSLVHTSLKIGKKNYLFGNDFINNPYAIHNAETKAKKVIFIGYGIADSNYDDYKGKDVAEKIVVFFTGEPNVNGKYLVTGTDKSSAWSFPGTSKKVALARQKGAVAAFVINPAIENVSATVMESAKKTNIYFPEQDPNDSKKLSYTTILPSISKQLFGEALFNDMITKAIAGDPLNDYQIEKRAKTKFISKKEQTPYYPTNVIGFIEGTDKKDEYVFLTAHYDHLGKKDTVIYYGADDDGSGTVSVIEMAEAFSKAKAEGKGPRRSVVFMTVSGEEKGLWGSEYYSNNPVFPLEKTTVDLNIDMVGRIDPGRKNGDSTNYLYVVGDDKLSSDLKPISTDINTKYSNLELDYKFNDPSDPEQIFFRSDHYNFAKKGVPIIFYFDGIHKDYHRPTDTVDKINFDLMEKRVQFIFLTAWEMANRESMLKRDIPLPDMER